MSDPKNGTKITIPTLVTSVLLAISVCVAAMALLTNYRDVTNTKRIDSHEDHIMLLYGENDIQDLNILEIKGKVEYIADQIDKLVEAQGLK